MMETQTSVSAEFLDRYAEEIAKLGGVLVAAIRQETCKYVLKCIVRAIEKQSLAYFLTEEATMLAVEYPDYVRHAAAHRTFMASLNELKGRAMVKGPPRKGLSYELAVEAVELVTDWRRDHIEGADSQLRTFLSNLRPLAFAAG